MDITKAHPSKYLKAGDLMDRTVTVEIESVVMETVGQGDSAEEKPCLYFRGKEKGIVLNVINGSVIADGYGDETDNWAGKLIEVYPDKTQFNGKIVDCIRVRVSAPPPGAGDDGQPAEIPF